MSLINDALKRARHEAARREAEARGLPTSVPPGQVFGRRGGPRLRPVLAGLAILAAVALGFVFFLAGQQTARRGGGAPGIEVAEAPAEAPAPTPQGAAEDLGAEREPASPRPDEAAPPADAGEIPAAASARTPAAGAGETPGGSRRAAEPRPSPATTRAAPTAPADSPAASGVASISDPASGVILVLPEAGRSRSAPAAAAGRGSPQGSGTASYIQTFTTPDGGTIELGGIAWSETGPFALINGQVLGAGSTIHGFVIERIHPRQVELRGGGGTVFLTLQ